MIICTKTNKRVVLQKRPSESILVRVGVTALSSLAVTAATTLSIVERNFYGTCIILWLSEATVRALAVATFSHPQHTEDDTTDDKKADNDHPNDDGGQELSSLTDASDGGGLKEGERSERTFLVLEDLEPFFAPPSTSLSSSSTAPAILLLSLVARGSAPVEEEEEGGVEREEEAGDVVGEGWTVPLTEGEG